MTRITCPVCRQFDEGFTVVWDIRVTTDVDAYGVSERGETDFANEIGRRRAINCRGCGYSWSTSRHLELPVEVYGAMDRLGRRGLVDVAGFEGRGRTFKLTADGRRVVADLVDDDADVAVEEQP